MRDASCFSWRIIINCDGQKKCKNFNKNKQIFIYWGSFFLMYNTEKCLSLFSRRRNLYCTDFPFEVYSVSLWLVRIFPLWTLEAKIITFFLNHFFRFNPVFKILIFSYISQVISSNWMWNHHMPAAQSLIFTVVILEPFSSDNISLVNIMANM